MSIGPRIMASNHVNCSLGSQSNDEKINRQDMEEHHQYGYFLNFHELNWLPLYGKQNCQHTQRRRIRSATHPCGPARLNSASGEATATKRPLHASQANAALAASAHFTICSRNREQRKRSRRKLPAGAAKTIEASLAHRDIQQAPS